MSLIKSFLRGLTPQREISLADWGDAHRWLTSEASAEPGPYRIARMPYLRGIAEALSTHSSYQEVVVMKGAQLGLTELGNNWLGYLITEAPAPILMAMPTEDTVKRNVKIRINPMIESTEVLAELMPPSRVRDSGNNLLEKKFPGGMLMMVGANSPAGLRSVPVRFIMLDEVDGYPNDAGGEGSPIELARARTRTYAKKKKIYIISTPTTKGSSAIEREFETTDQRYFFVPCPECGTVQTLEFEQLRWEPGQHETVQYECAHCRVLIPERKKTVMLNQGQWQATVEDNVTPGKIGFHINSLYSPYGMYSWAEIARKWDEIQGKHEEMKTFFNTVLGKTWETQGEVPEWERLYERRENYQLNRPAQEVYFITAGVDVQADRLEVQIVGWGKRKRSWVIDYRVILGDTAALEVWDKLALIVRETWEREDGVVLPMRMMCVDAGYNTPHVYTFCQRFAADQVVPVKGQDKQGVMLSSPRPVHIRKDGKPVKVGALKLWNVGVSLLKSELYGWLRLTNTADAEPDGYCHFPMLDAAFFRGITAETLEFKLVRGFKQYAWMKKYKANEPLDTRNYARAAAEIVGISRFTDAHYEAMLGQYSRRERAENKQVSRKTEPDSDGFWSGW